MHLVLCFVPKKNVFKVWNYFISILLCCLAMTCSVPNARQNPSIKVTPYKETYSRDDRINIACSEGYYGRIVQPTKQCIYFGDLQRNLPHCTGNKRSLLKIF